MNKIFLLSRWGCQFMLLSFLMCGITNLNAQINQQKYPIGTFQSLAEQLNQTSKNEDINIALAGGKTVQGQINVSKIENQGEVFIGNISGDNKNTFHFILKDGSFSGYSVLRNTEQAFKYFTENGNVYVQETDINKVLCINYGEQATTSNKAQQGAVVAQALNPAVANLQSLPGAAGCVLLDFDGQYVSGTPWNGGNPIDAQPSGMSDAAIQEAWEVVSEDYRPFKVNITTNEAVFNSYPKSMRMRAIFTPTTTAAPGTGGVAYIGSFSWNDDTPCWVFVLSGKNGGEAASHEVGHTFSLGHDGRTTPSEAYYAGQGNWAPIMGVSYYKTITQWSKGEYTSANNLEDDLSKISGANFGVGYRNDDHGNTTGAATALKIGSGGAVSATENFGIVERTSDLDFFSFTTSGGTVSLNINTVARDGDLDILAKLYNSGGTLINSYDPNGLNSSISTSLAAGTYYISVDGTGVGNPAVDGYSDYASLGSFFISGTVPNTVVTNTPPSVAISSPTAGSVYTAPANIGITANASDADGTVSKVEFFANGTKIGEKTTSPYTLSWSTGTGTYSLTAVATDNGGATKTSTAVSITVNPASSNQLPVVSIISPGAGSTFNAQANINITANASDPDGSVSKVEFFANGIKIGEKTTSPYALTWTASQGSYNLTAIATDNLGAKKTSATVSITVNAVAGCSIAAWTSSSIYWGGMRASYNGILYEAKWWTQGERPDLSGQWDVWKVISACGSAPIAAKASNGTEVTNHLSVYPNPGNGVFNVKMVLNDVSDVSIYVVDLTGSEVARIKYIQTSEINEVMNLSHLSSGIYFVNTLVNNELTTGKIIIQ
jgi:chitodextrinase